jgi:diguanylate cyclase (GGDEF)-like protein
LYLYYSNYTAYINGFLIILTIAISSRVALTYYSKKTARINLVKYAYLYAVASFIIALDFSFISFNYFILADFELRYFIMLVHLGLIAAAIITLSVWMSAYLAFSLPQLVTLISIFFFNNTIAVALITIIFSVFILATAKKFNKKYKEGQLLIAENEQLIADMEKQIVNKDRVQIELENQQERLETMVAARTSELETINANLKKEMIIREKIEEELEHLAYYDELTGLPNHTLLIEILRKSLIQAKRNESLLSVVFIDLDRFKNINDSHGHHIGDELLKDVAKRLKDVLRDSDTITRNGSDEFVIIIENMKDVREPFVVANKVIKTLNQKFHIEGHDIHIGASVGISLYPLDGDNALDLIKMSDTAMYEAKKIGRNNFQFYSSAMSNKIKDRLQIENALREALKNDEFFLVFQPQVNLHTNETSGFEALIRWNSAEFGIVPPFKFIPILEETGLIYSVGEWIIQQALGFIKSGKSRNKKVSINLSALQCSVSNFSAQIEKMIKEHNVDPQRVEFEITETLLINDFSQTEMFLTDISKLGCTIALDDFGTGYTSFSYLTKLPIDTIKIDRSLITGIHQNDDLKNIVRAIVTMSNSLGIENIFEGVETEDELTVLKEIHAKIIQGYLFSKPLELSQIDNWFDSIDYESAHKETV